MEEGRDDKQRELGSASIVNNEPYTLGKLRACICMSLRPSALVCHFRESINTFTTIEPSEYNIPGMEICHRPCPHLLHTYTCIYPAIYTYILILHHVYCIMYSVYITIPNISIHSPTHRVKHINADAVPPPRVWTATPTLPKPGGPGPCTFSEDCECNEFVGTLAVYLHRRYVYEDGVCM